MVVSLTLLAGDAERRRRYGVEPLQADLPAAATAFSVATDGDPLDGVVDLCQELPIPEILGDGTLPELEVHDGVERVSRRGDGQLRRGAGNSEEKFLLLRQEDGAVGFRINRCVWHGEILAQRGEVRKRNIYFRQGKKLLTT